MHTQGDICLDILEDKWSTYIIIRTILLSVWSLLGEPNTDNPLNTQGAEFWGEKAPQPLKSICKKPTQSRSPAKIPDCPTYSPCVVFLFSPYMVCPSLHFCLGLCI